MNRNKSLNKKRADKSIEIRHFEQKTTCPYVVYKEELLLFEELAKTKKESFFNQQRRETEWTIFDIIKDNDHPNFHSNIDILEKYYFSQEECESMQKKFYDLMAISNGRLTSFVLLQYFKEKDMACKAELDEKEQRLKQQRKWPGKIIYDLNSTNRGIDFKQDILDRGDILA